MRLRVDDGQSPLKLAGHALVALSILVATAALAAPRPPRAPRAPRTPVEIGRVLAEGPHAGDCESCHTQHAADQPEAYPRALIGPDDNTLCDRCHTGAWSSSSYGGTWLYAGSAHGSGTSMLWPGPDPPARGDATDAGLCVNCHDPHGWTDAAGRIPGLMVAREEALCLTCHDGHPAAADVRTEFLKPFRHPVTTTGRHAGAESLPEDFGTSPLPRRHAECEDCHNPHVARADGPLPLAAPAASARNLGVSRVAVLNGTAGSPPIYTFLPASDTLTAPVAEYQLCFKCHSSWTTQPAGQTDFGRVLNPNNPSTHPVEAAGRDVALHPLSFASGWSATSLTRCGDCHGSDLGAPAGPHGSTNRHLLKRPYDESPLPRTTTEDELCFQCHAAPVYLGGPSPALLAYSRFNPPQVTGGHALHVSTNGVPCGACHVTHGSTTLPSLLVVGRNPGILSYQRTFDGGTCTTTCHAPQSYTVNYGR
jgi:predicted CXXCH cytochrome family protein